MKRSSKCSRGMQEPHGKVWEAVKQVQGECRRLQNALGVWGMYRHRNVDGRGIVTKGRRLRVETEHSGESKGEEGKGIVGGLKTWELKGGPGHRLAGQGRKSEGQKRLGRGVVGSGVEIR